MWEAIKKFFGFGKKHVTVVVESKAHPAQEDIVVSPVVAEALKVNREVYRHTPSPRVTNAVSSPAPKPTESKTVSKQAFSAPYSNTRRDEVDNTTADLVTAYAIANMMSTPAYAPIYGSGSSRYDSDCSSTSYSSSSSDSSYSSCDSGSSSSSDW